MEISRLRVMLLAVLLLAPSSLRAYSVQTHEQLIDLSWKHSIKPFLSSRFPRATDAEIEHAHAYAYGGCAIQDLGYYPFGNEFFSNLTHYVRSGDFIRNLFREAKNPDELAFAIGALSHYVGDSLGHSVAVNPAVAIEFPKLEKRYGPSVTYDESPHAHVRTEFAFDIDEISKHRMAPSAYLRYVGLRVPSSLLASAFFDTYGLDFKQVLGKRRPVVRGYRFAVRSFIPVIAYAETVLHRSDFPPAKNRAALYVGHSRPHPRNPSQVRGKPERFHRYIAAATAKLGHRLAIASKPRSGHRREGAPRTIPADGSNLRQAVKRHHATALARSASGIKTRYFAVLFRSSGPHQHEVRPG